MRIRSMTRTILALLLMTVSTLSGGQTDTPIRRPEIRVGDSWTYRSTNIIGPGAHEQETRVTFIDDKVILAVSTRKSDGKEFDSSWTNEWNSVTTHGGSMYRPHSGVVRFPLNIGDKHEVKYDLLRPRASTILSSTTGTVAIVGWETVEVPAGKFRAVRIELDSMVQPSDGSRAYPRQVTYWYSPDVRRWVKLLGFTSSARFDEELLSYKLNEN